MTYEMDRELSLPDDTHEDLGVDVTAVMRIKHADLWAAAKQVGGCRKLAEHLGVSDSDIYAWVKMERVPPPGPSRGKWTEDFWYSFEAKLFAITGKTMEQLFPESLRSNRAFLKASKTMEKTARLSHFAMLTYAESTRDRMLLDAKGADQKKKDRDAAIAAAMENLTYREREVIRVRYGMDGPEKTLDEAAAIFKVTRERVRQIEAKAIRKLQLHGKALDDLRETLYDK